MQLRHILLLLMVATIHNTTDFLACAKIKGPPKLLASLSSGSKYICGLLQPLRSTRCTLAWRGYWLLSIPSRTCQNPRELGTSSWVNGTGDARAKVSQVDAFQHLLSACCGSRVLRPIYGAQYLQRYKCVSPDHEMLETMPAGAGSFKNLTSTIQTI